MNHRLWPPVLAVAAVLALSRILLSEHDTGREPAVSSAGGFSGGVSTAPDLTITAGDDGDPPLPAAPETSGASAPSAVDEPRRYTARGQPISVSRSEAGEDIINVGRAIDPDDPATWPEVEGEEVVNVGEYVDPDDPSYLARYDEQVPMNFGPYLDPDDPSTWAASESSEVIDVGEYRDADAPQTWSRQDDDEVINVGEYVDAELLLDRD